MVFRCGKHHTAVGKCLAPEVFDRILSALKSTGFVLQQRRHMLFHCQASHGNGIIVLQGLSVAGNAGQLVAAVVLFYLYGNAADYRQRATVERG